MISVVIPAYNEEGAIAATIAGVRAVIADADEVVVVDDGSTDATASIAATHDVTVVRHVYNIGYGWALKHGIERAKHDTIVILDADGTYPAVDIPRLLKVYEQGFDMVVGARSPTTIKEPVFKSALRTILTMLVEFTVGRRVPDVNSGLRVFNRITLRPYFAQLCDTFSFTTSLTLAYMMTGRFVAYLPIAYGERVGRTKVRMFRDTLRTLQYIVLTIVYFNPTKIFLLLSVTCFSTAFIIAVAALAVSRAAAAVIMAFGIVGGIAIFALGLMADLLRQIMQNQTAKGA
jgi:glycosyltransferase involved in cell wall biosynthesis